MVIIGNSSSVFMKDFLSDVCVKLFDEVIFLSVSLDGWSYYQSLRVTMFFTGTCSTEGTISEQERKEEERRRRDEICDKIDDIDVLQVHYCHGGAHMYCYKKLIAKSKKKYMVYWGSDLLRSNQENIVLNRSAIEASDRVICLTESLKRVAIQSYGELLCNKIIVLDFGVIYADIKKALSMYDRSYCKRKMGFPETKYSIMVGYNGSRGQQHIEILNVLKKLKTESKDKMFVFIPMSYGLDLEYRNDVEEKVKEIGVPYVFIDDFLDRDELVLMRVATDVFIHAQITDALSNSLCECLYAGARVLNPSWLDYPELLNNRIPYYEYQDFDDLLPTLEKILEELPGKEKRPEYAKRLWELNEREQMYGKWRQLLAE